MSWSDDKMTDCRRTPLAVQTGGPLAELPPEETRAKFLGEICAPEKETYFYVGTVLKWPKSWVVIGAFYPRYGKSGSPIGRTGELFTR